MSTIGLKTAKTSGSFARRISGMAKNLVIQLQRTSFNELWFLYDFLENILQIKVICKILV